MAKVQKPQNNKFVKFDIPLKNVNYLLVLLCLACTGFLIYALWYSFNLNGFFGFTLDDSWIHLQFAKNLNEYGSFSYFKNENVTAGSTAPLFTFLLAAGLFITKNEMLLSYFFGILFFSGSVYYFFKLLMEVFNKSIIIALAGSILLVLEPRLVWVSLSGMETTFAIFLLLSSLYYYRTKKNILFGICAGFLLWVRPEAIILFGAYASDILYHKYWIKKVSKNKTQPLNDIKWILPSIIIISILSVIYVTMNLYLSGSIFPNTFSAKIKYYSGGSTDYWKQLLEFITSKQLIPFAIFIGIGIIYSLTNIVKRKTESSIVFLVWIAGMVLAYNLYLPYLYQKGRYLMPILPLLIIFGLSGLIVTINFITDKFSSLSKRAGYLYLTSVIMIIFIFQSGFGSIKMIDEYSRDCKYINDRQVITAKWLKNNLPENAVIATHDVGAIAYYSERKIVDMVGLVSPDMIENIGSYDKLLRFLNSKGVTHISVLRNWFHIGNQNRLYNTDLRYPEIMEVFEYSRDKIVFVPADVDIMNNNARYLLSTGQFRQAGLVLDQSLRRFSGYDDTHYLMGLALEKNGNHEMAKENYRKALLLNPYNKAAEIELSKF